MVHHRVYFVNVLPPQLKLIRLNTEVSYLENLLDV